MKLILCKKLSIFNIIENKESVKFVQNQTCSFVKEWTLRHCQLHNICLKESLASFFKLFSCCFWHWHTSCSLSSSTSIMSIRQQFYQCSNFYVIFLHIFYLRSKYKPSTDLVLIKKKTFYRPKDTWNTDLFWYYSLFWLSRLHIRG